MRVTLVKTPVMWDMGPDLAIFCNQARLSVVGLGH